MLPTMSCTHCSLQSLFFVLLLPLLVPVIGSVTNSSKPVLTTDLFEDPLLPLMIITIGFNF